MTDPEVQTWLPGPTLLQEISVGYWYLKLWPDDSIVLSLMVTFSFEESVEIAVPILRARKESSESANYGENTEDSLWNYEPWIPWTLWFPESLDVWSWDTYNFEKKINFFKKGKISLPHILIRKKFGLKWKHLW